MVGFLFIDPPPPPMDVYLMAINRHQMTFSWNPVRLSACEAVQYYTFHTNYGICPNSTNTTTATCTDYNISRESVCMFAVQSVTCYDVVGPMSNVTTVALKGIT